MDNFKYGNMYEDIMLLIKYYDLCQKSCISELSERKRYKMLDKVINDLKNHENDIIPFYYNDIKTVYTCMTSTDIENASFKFFNIIGDSNEYNSLETLEEYNNYKLKALAYLKLLIQYKSYDFEVLVRMIPALLLNTYCSIDLNKDTEYIKNKIFNTTLQEIMKDLMVGLTPRQLYGLLPIKKEYNGDKYCMRDYYSCMKEVEEIGLDTPMNEKQVMHYIMECNTNPIIIKLGANFMSLVMDYNNWSFYDMLDNFEESRKPKLVVDNTKKDKKLPF